LSQRPFAVFDIDGTLIRWQLYHAVVDALVKAGHIDAKKFAKAQAARMVWKRRSHAASFSDYEHSLVTLHNECLKHIAVSDYLAAVQKVFNEYKDQTYTYTRDLIRQLKGDGYLLFAISASQLQIIEPLAKYYGFDDYIGAVLEEKNGRFSGQINSPIGKKAELLNTLIAKHHSSLAGSIAVGDSESDIAMLELTERAIAFNPTKQLLAAAREHGWRVVVERKNVVYKLDSDNGQYVLA
jgi:HAD superfamily hydrolase (TIGR01490 family)